MALPPALEVRNVKVREMGKAWKREETGMNSWGLQEKWGERGPARGEEGSEDEG